MAAEKILVAESKRAEQVFLLRSFDIFSFQHAYSDSDVPSPSLISSVTSEP